MVMTDRFAILTLRIEGETAHDFENGKVTRQHRLADPSGATSRRPVVVQRACAASWTLFTCGGRTSAPYGGRGCHLRLPRRGRPKQGRVSSYGGRSDEMCARQVLAKDNKPRRLPRAARHGQGERTTLLGSAGRRLLDSSLGSSF